MRFGRSSIEDGRGGGGGCQENRAVKTLVLVVLCFCLTCISFCEAEDGENMLFKAKQFYLLYHWVRSYYPHKEYILFKIIKMFLRYNKIWKYYCIFFRNLKWELFKLFAITMKWLLQRTVYCNWILTIKLLSLN